MEVQRYDWKGIILCMFGRFDCQNCMGGSVSPRLSILEFVDDFISEVQIHDQKVPYTGRLKSPQVLADIVESLAGAIYVDDDLKLGTVWVVISGLLEPLITLDMIDELPQPATTTYIEANIPEFIVEPKSRARSASTSLPEKRKGSAPSGGLLAALLAKKRKASATAPMGPLARNSSAKRGRKKVAKLASALESELENMKARVVRLEAELSSAREASRRAEAEVENARKEAKEQALEEYGDEIVGVVNKYYFDSHVRALTLAGVAPRDLLWYNVEFPFEGTVPEMKFPWEGERSTNGEPSEQCSSRRNLRVTR